MQKTFCGDARKCSMLLTNVTRSAQPFHNGAATSGLRFDANAIVDADRIRCLQPKVAFGQNQAAQINTGFY